MNTSSDNDVIGAPNNATSSNNDAFINLTGDRNDKRKGKRPLAAARVETYNLLTSSNSNTGGDKRRGKRPVVVVPSPPRRRGGEGSGGNQSRNRNRNLQPGPSARVGQPSRGVVVRAPMRGARVVRHRPAELPGFRRNAAVNNLTMSNNAVQAGLITRFGGYQLQPHQISVSQLFVKPTTPGLLLYFKVGSGKTLASIAAVENLARVERLRRKVLVVGPAPLERNYFDELRRAGVDASRYEFMSFQKVHAIAARVRAAAKLRNPEADDATIRRAMGREMSKLGVFEHRVRGIRVKMRKVLVIDEVQNLKKPLGELLASVLEVARAAHKRLLLTGTPVVNYPMDIGAYLGLIDPDHNERLTVKTLNVADGMPEAVFESTFGKSATQRMPLLDSLLKCTTLFYEPSADIQRAHYPTKTEHWVDVPLSGQQVRRHFEIAVKMPTPDNIDDIHPSALADQRNTRMFVNAARQVNNIWGVYHPKIDVLVANIIHEVKNRDGKCVFYDFYEDSLKTVERLLKRDNAMKVAAFTGKTPKPQRAAIVQDYNRGDLNVLLLSSAGGEGLDLKNTTQMHILQPWWNDEKINQVIGRGVRFQSHTGPRRHVDVFRYCSVFPPNVDKSAFLPAGKIPKDLGFAYRFTADELLKNISIEKSRANRIFLERLVRISDQNRRTCV